MIITRLIRNVMRTGAPTPMTSDDRAPTALSVLNVGGGSKQIAIPSHYADWNHFLLDVSAGPDVDVVLDARKLKTLDAEQFDSVYCSHNLEHYYRHDCANVLSGFVHVLKRNGYADIRVPDMAAVLTKMVADGMDIDDILYTSTAGPISVHDVIYGWGVEIERSGVDFYAHKRGFTAKSLTVELQRAGFARVVTSVSGTGFEIRALAFKAEPTGAQRAMFGF